MITTVPLFPLSHGLFPDGMLSLQIFEVRYLDLIKRCHQQQLPFGVAWLEDGSEVQVAGQTPLMHRYGCMAHIRSLEQVQANFFRAVCQGGLRFELHSTQSGPLGVWQGQVSMMAQDPVIELPPEFQQLADRLGKVVASAQQQGQSQNVPMFAPYLLDECGWVANRYAEAMDIDSVTQMQLLTEPDPLKRIRRIDALLKGE